MEQENKPKETTQWIVTISICGGLILGTLAALMNWETLGIISGIMGATGLALIGWGFLTDMNKE